MRAHSSSTPSPVTPETSDTVAPAAAPSLRARSPQHAAFGGAELVGLGDDQVAGHLHRAEPFHELELFGGQRAAGVHQHQDETQGLALLDVALDQDLPGAPLGVRNLRVPVAGQVDQAQALRARGARPAQLEVEEHQAARPPRRLRHPGQRVPSRHAVEQRRLADVRTPGDGHLRRAGGRQSGRIAGLAHEGGIENGNRGVIRHGLPSLGISR